MKQIMAITLVICCFLTACNKENIVDVPYSDNNVQDATANPGITDSKEELDITLDIGDNGQKDALVPGDNDDQDDLIVPPATVPPEVDLDKKDGGLVAIYFCWPMFAWLKGGVGEETSGRIRLRSPSTIGVDWVEHVLKFPELPNRQVYVDQQGKSRFTYYVSDQYIEDLDYEVIHYDDQGNWHFEVKEYSGKPFDVKDIPKWDDSKALIINNPGVTGLDPYPLVDSLKQLKEDRQDVLLMSDRPFKLVKENIETVDVVVFDDEIAIGKRMVEYAYAQNAKTFVYYYISTEEKPVPGDELRMAAVKSSCEKLGIEFVPELMSLVEPIERMDSPIDPSKKLLEYGNNTAFIYYYKERAVDFWLTPDLIAYGTINEHKKAIHILDPSLSLRDRIKYVGSDGLARFDRFDYRFFFEEMKKTPGDQKYYTSDTFTGAPVDMDILYLAAMSRYALAYADGNTVLKKANKEFFRYCLQEAMTELGFPECNVYVNTYEEYGDNCFFISTDFITIY